MRFLGILVLLIGFLSTTAGAQEWTKTAGALNQISAVDETTAWGVSKNDEVFRTKDSGKTWQRVPATLRQVSALSYDSAWGVNGSQQVWRTNNGGANWDNRPGRLKQVSAADYETAWGVNDTDEILRTNNGGANWVKSPGLLSQISALSFDSAWGVNAAGQIWRTKNGGANWDNRPGQLKWVSAASYEEAAGVNAQHGIYRTRDGGASWQEVPGLLQQISALSYESAWGVNAGNEIFVRVAANAGAQAGGAGGSSQVVQAEAVIKTICPEGQAAAAGGACVAEVFFHREAGLSLDQALARAAESGNALATRPQVIKAWYELQFDAYAYGRLADGSFAVPVQGDHSNYKKGVNLDATGGNQGFFFVVGCPAGFAPGFDGDCENTRVKGAFADISKIELEPGMETSLTQISNRTWVGSSGRYYVETGRDGFSIYLTDMSSEARKLVFNLYQNKVSFTDANSKSVSEVVKASDGADRRSWVTPHHIAKSAAGVTRIGYGNYLPTRPDQLGVFQQIAGGGWVQTYRDPTVASQESTVTGITEVSRSGDKLTLRDSGGKVFLIDLSAKTVSAQGGGSIFPTKPGIAAKASAFVVWTGNDPLPTAEQARQNALIADQEVASNTNRLLTSPLSENDLNSVMEWIGKQDSASTVPYCYRNTSPRDGFEWKPGDPDLPNYSGPKGRCEATYGAGKCEQDLGLMYPTCKAGEYGDGPLCWQHCPTTRMVLETGQNTKLSCGIGCALNNDICVKQTADMVLAPINAVLSILSLGTSSAATSASNAALGGAADAAAGVTKVALSDPKWLKLLAALDKAEDIFGKITDAKDDIEYLMDNVENLETEINRWNGEYDDNFASLTSSRIDMIIDQKFPDPDDASYIKQKYGQYKLTTMLESDQWRIWRSVATFAGFEPTGIVATVDVFAQPMCIHKAEPFPAVKILGKSQRGAPDPLIRAN